LINWLGSIVIKVFLILKIIFQKLFQLLI